MLSYLKVMNAFLSSVKFAAAHLHTIIDINNRSIDSKCTCGHFATHIKYRRSIKQEKSDKRWVGITARANAAMK